MLDTGIHHFGLAKDRISQERHPIQKPVLHKRNDAPVKGKNIS